MPRKDDDAVTTPPAAPPDSEAVATLAALCPDIAFGSREYAMLKKAVSALSPGVGHEGHRSRLRGAMEGASLDAFSDEEVLELLLAYGTPRKDTREAARELIKTYGSLLNVLCAPADELRRTKNVTAGAAELITLVRDVCRDPDRHNCVIDSTSQAVRFFGSMYYGGEEGSVVAYLDGRHELIALERGSPDRLADLRTVVAAACAHGASYVIISRFEQELLPACFNIAEDARYIAEALSAVGILLTDAFVFGPYGYYAFDGLSANKIFIFIPSMSASISNELCEALYEATDEF